MSTKLEGKELEAYKARLAEAWQGGTFKSVGLQPAGEYEAFGEVRSLSQWAKRLGISKTSLCRYIHKGLTIEEACELRGIEYEPQ